MSIAEKLQTIANNMQSVYNAGYEKGKAEVGGSGEQPTLFTPSISLNQPTSVLTITDSKNGGFVKDYNVYANDELITVLTSKTATLTDYIEFTKTFEIKVQAEGENFNPSDYSNVIEWTYYENAGGSDGLVYRVSTGSGTKYATLYQIGTLTETDIVMANYYEEWPVKYMNMALFKNNTSITSFTCSDALLAIEYETFFGCSSLEQIVMGLNTKLQDGRNFSGCASLKRIDYSKSVSVPSCSSYEVFKGTPSDLQIKVPENLIDEWKNATNWADYADKIVTEFTNEL